MPATCTLNSNCPVCSAEKSGLQQRLQHYGPDYDIPRVKPPAYSDPLTASEYRYNTGIQLDPEPGQFLEVGTGMGLGWGLPELKSPDGSKTSMQ